MGIMYHIIPDVGYIDQHSESGTSLLHRLHPLSKFIIWIGTTAAAISTEGIETLLLFLPIASALLLMSRIKMALALKWLPIPLIPSLGAVASSLQHTHGSEGMAIFVRSIIITITGLAVVSSTPIAVLISYIGFILPQSVRDMLYIAYRYLFVLMDEARRMLMAMESRCFRPSIKYVPHLLTRMLLRALDRSLRISMAMESRCTGRGLKVPSPAVRKGGIMDIIFTTSYLSLMLLIRFWW